MRPLGRGKDVEPFEFLQVGVAAMMSRERRVDLPGRAIRRSSGVNDDTSVAAKMQHTIKSVFIFFVSLRSISHGLPTSIQVT
jgi:hypothetical protein